MMADNIESTAPVTDGAAPEAAAPEGQRRGRGGRGGGDNRGGGVAAVAVAVTITIVVHLRKKMMARSKSSSTSTVFLKQSRVVSASVLPHWLLSAMAKAA